ncbi:MAG: hypothetical protein Fur0034_02270 [Desulfuromonadia bacterium]
MGEPVRLPVPPDLIPLIGRDAPLDARRSVARGEHPLSPEDEGIALVVLFTDPDPEVRGVARQRILQMPEDRVSLIRERGANPLVIRLFQHLRPDRSPTPPPVGDAPPPAGNVDMEEEIADTFPEMTEEFRNKYQMVQKLGVSEKIKYALTGDKEWRSILIRDSNKQVSGAVIKNPRITDAEVLAICKSAIQNDEVIRIICQNREWVKNYQIRKALVENTRTPLASALRFLSTLGEKDLASIAKSKNISSVIVNQARRLLIQKKKE